MDIVYPKKRRMFRGNKKSTGCLPVDFKHFITALLIWVIIFNFINIHPKMKSSLIKNLFDL